MKRHVLFGLAAGLLLLGAGCFFTPKRPIGVTNIVQERESWTPVAPSVDKLIFTDSGKTGVTAVIYRLSHGSFRWHFISSTTTRTIAGWASSVPSAALVANGVYFTSAAQPAGFLAVSGTRIGTSAFDLNRTALLTLSPEPRIIDTTAETISLRSVRDGAQSYPFLVKRGADALTMSTSTAIARRTFIGLDQDRNTYVGVVSDHLIGLGDLAHLLMRTGIAWDDVLNLDGGPSTGVYVRTATSTELINSDTQIPNVLIAEPQG